MLPQRKTTTLGSAINSVIRMGYVVDLHNGFLVDGVAHRLVVVQDQVKVETGGATIPWDTFTRTFRPQ